MRYGRVIILLISSCFLIVSSYAQPGNKYIFRHIDQSDGLLHNRVFSIVQDARGFIWLITPNGLQRYDGNRFVNYPYNPADASGISYNPDCRLYSDKKNNQLWLANEAIGKLDLQKNKFFFYSTEQLLKDPFFGFEKYEDSLHNTWLAGDFGVFRFDSSTHKMQGSYLTVSRFDPGKSSPLIVDESRNEIWLTLWSKGLFLLDKKTKKVYSHDYNPIHHPLLELMDNNLLFYLFEDHDKNIWISSSRPEFYKFEPATRKITVYSLRDIKKQQGEDNNEAATLLVRCMFEDDHHTLWVGTQNAGLLKYNKETGDFISITAQKETQQGVHYNYDISCIFQDNEENIWLGTDRGITIFNPYRQYFRSVYTEENNPRSLPKYEIQECIETRNGDILAGTWGGGITVFDSQWHFKKNIHFPPVPEEYNLTWCFIQNDDGTIWIGCQHGYIHIYDPVKETIRTIHPPELNHFTIHSMVKDANGNIWLGLHDGKVAKWDRSQNKFYPYNVQLPGIRQAFAPVLCMHIDHQQQCWVGTENGLKQFDMNNRIYSAVYVTNRNNPGAISANTIQSIDSFDDSTIMMGTVYGGLDFFHKKTKIFSHLSTDEGFPSNTINNLKKDAGNNCWFTTDYGLYKYIPLTRSLIKYNIDPGIINSAFKSGNFYSLKNGSWLACTITEIISFNPDSLQNQVAGNKRVDITGFKIFDKDIFIDSLLYSGKPVKLSHRQNFLSIEYGAISFSGLQETKYYYRLSGINKDWVYANSKRVANYTNLEPGTYTFSVKAENEGADENITTFTIIITPPFWKTAWFRSIILLLIVTTGYLLFRKRVKSIRHEAAMKQRMAETEMMALRAQMNPHFIFNCLNSIDSLIQNNEKEKATTYLAKFARLIRAILENSKSNIIPCWKDLETLKLYLELEEFRWDKKFSYRLDIGPEILQGDYKVPPMIIQPYVENAIHHGLLNKEHGSKELIIEINASKNHIRYMVEDNGIGRKKAEAYKQVNKPRHESMSMDITRDRISLFNRDRNGSVKITDLYDKDNNPIGTRVELNLINPS